MDRSLSHKDHQLASRSVIFYQGGQQVVAWRRPLWPCSWRRFIGGPVPPVKPFFAVFSKKFCPLFYWLFRPLSLDSRCRICLSETALSPSRFRSRSCMAKSVDEVVRTHFRSFV